MVKINNMYLIKLKGAELYLNESFDLANIGQAKEYKTKGGATCAITKYNKDYPTKFEDKTGYSPKSFEYVEVHKQFIKII
jgi:hypothetical protein